MTELRTVRVAALQATPVMLDAEATVAKACRLLAEAAAEGAELAVLPETFVVAVPVERVGGQRGRVQRARRAVGAAVGRARSTCPARTSTRSRPRARSTGSTA